MTEHQTASDAPAMEPLTLEPMVAFLFHNENDQWQEEIYLIFSIDQHGAERQFDYGCDCENRQHVCGWVCERAPRFDKYAPGPMTAENWLDAGCSVDCEGCGKHLSEDIAEYDAIVYDAGDAYCTKFCLERTRKADAHRRMLRQHTQERFPGVDIADIRVPAAKLHESVVRFYFSHPHHPFVRFAVVWTPAKDEVQMKARAIPAFAVYMASLKPATEKPA